MDLGPEDDFADDEEEDVEELHLDNNHREQDDAAMMNSPSHHMTVLNSGNNDMTTPSAVAAYAQFPSQPSPQSSPSNRRGVAHEGSGGGVSRSVSPLSSIGSVDLIEGKEDMNGTHDGSHMYSSPSHRSAAAATTGLPMFSSFMQTLADASAIVVNTVTTYHTPNTYSPVELIHPLIGGTDFLTPCLTHFLILSLVLSLIPSLLSPLFLSSSLLPLILFHTLSHPPPPSQVTLNEMDRRSPDQGPGPGLGQGPTPTQVQAQAQAHGILQSPSSTTNKSLNDSLPSPIPVDSPTLSGSLIR